MKKFIAMFTVLLAASGFAQAQNTSLLRDHPDARNDRPASSYVAEHNPRVHARAHHHGKSHHHGKAHHHRKHR